MTLKVVVFASCKEGKVDRLRELVKWESSEIKATEPDISHYKVFVADGEKDGIKEVLCTCSKFALASRLLLLSTAYSITDEEALVRRRQLKHHMEFAAIVENEGLLETLIRYLILKDIVDE
ncbi:hypothetical protein LTR81_028124 [Elasticomyces elasticus]